MAKIGGVQEVRRELLRPYENNAKIHSKSQVKQIAESIKEFGFLSPCLIDKEYNIIRGHGRVMAREMLEMETVPCVFIEGLTETQRKAYILADNRLTELGEWDFDKVQIELKELEDLDFNIELTGFEIEDDNEPVDIVEDDFSEDVESVRKTGDIWKLGRHTLMCGDSTRTESVEELIGSKKIDLFFTDPPYQLETQGGGILKNANSMKQIAENGVDTFDPSSLTMWGETNVFFHNKPLIKSYIELAEKNGLPYDLAFYKKRNTVPNYKGHLMTDVEYIAIIGNQDPNKGLEKEMYSKVYIGQKDTDNNLSYSKPVNLCAKFIQLYSQNNVVDLYGGSGSTLIACEQLDRECLMMEIDPHYCDVIIQRWENLTGQKAVRING